MRQDELMSTMRMRSLKAIAIVMAVLVTVPGVDVVAHVAATSKAIDASGVGLDVGALMGAGDAYAALDQVEGALAANESDVPETFVEEVGLLPGARDVRSGGGGAVVGYVVAGEAEEVMEQISSQMRERGWTPVPLGDIAGATFLKEEGEYTWTLVTCTQVGSEVSVVARCMAE